MSQAQKTATYSIPQGLPKFRQEAVERGEKAEKATRFWPFAKARQYVRDLNLTGQTQWIQYVKMGLKPSGIPSNPNVVYSEWKGYGDWTGGGSPFITRYREYRSYNEAKKFVKSLNLKSSVQWEVYSRSGLRPQDIPSDPRKIYFQDWKNWNSFLGVK